ncbi:hypothetical protein GXW82_28945 [Streptacidiphilus sp. 4-A2]|nr:hypothetical protein [Streptacidiphilus sp. 4-A2]
MLEDLGRVEEPAAAKSPGSRWVTGCLGTVLLPVLLVVGTVIYQHVTDDTPTPTHLSDDQLIGTWKSADGGVLVLQPDGTFSAVRICGFGTSDPQVGSDTGTWVQGDGSNLFESPAAATSSVVLFGKINQNELDEGDRQATPCCGSTSALRMTATPSASFTGSDAHRPGGSGRTVQAAHIALSSPTS